MKPVLTKADFVRRYTRSEFGNRAPTWSSLAEFLASGYNGAVHLRNRVVGGPTWYDVPSDRVESGFKAITALGQVTAENVYFSGMAPTHATLIQGEIQQTTRHLYLYSSTVPQPMRDSLRMGGAITEGMRAIGLLKKFLDASSYDWVQELLENYPDHVIEFSTYRENWGTVPNRNTVIWEVRKY